jgi:ATP-dependent RNA helicase DDX31/DBP7
MLQLNLVEDQEPFKKSISSITSKLKKGGWRQKRLDAKRIVHKIRKANKPVDGSLEQVKPTKKKEEAPKQEIFKRKIISNKSEKRIGSEQKNFTSSLFTANPDVKIAPKPRLASVEEPKEIVKVLPKAPEPITPKTSLLKGFAALGLQPILSNHLEKLKITSPTEIQNISIPKLLNVLDRDMIIQAQTGSGKTFAFLLPILNHLMTANAKLEQDSFTRYSGCFALILVPTRELAQQISMVLESLLKYTSDSEHKHWIVSGLITGGESKKSEKSRLRKGINILVATPGRLLDHLKTTESFYVGNLRWLVLDEADNLLHLGFEETLKEILLILNQTGLKAAQSQERKQ